MNITTRINENACKFEQRKAVVFPTPDKGNTTFTYQHLSYGEFSVRSKSLANALSARGVKKGERVLLFVKPCLELPVLVFALFRIGAIPVVIDPGIGRQRLLEAIKHAAPTTLISEPIFHFIRHMFLRSLRSVNLAISAKELVSMANFRSTDEISDIAELSPDDPALIVFTSGATGSPKGVVYTHSMLYSQLNLIEELVASSLNVDLSCFPLFALFSLGMGKTSIIPHMDVSKPAQADGAHLVRHIRDFGVEMATGSPAIWIRLAHYCKANSVTLPTLRSIVMFGAPVPVWLHELLRAVMPNADTFTPYGATEALPVSWISGSRIIAEFKEAINAGQGVCVGKVVRGTKVKIIDNYDDEHLENLSSIKEASTHTVGEIAVCGSQITRSYFCNPKADAAAKIADDGQIWHRMGDLGYMDSNNNLWFCGRKDHWVELNNKRRFPAMVEAIFNQHSEVNRSALIPLADKAAVVVERKDHAKRLGTAQHRRFINELRWIGSRYEVTRDIKHFFIHPHFPVDCRHNIKIDRKALHNTYKNRAAE